MDKECIFGNSESIKVGYELICDCKFVGKCNLSESFLLTVQNFHKVLLIKLVNEKQIIGYQINV